MLGANSIFSQSQLEGQSDWPMFQYNAQHTGHNDKDEISVPLRLQWQISICDGCPVEPITVVGENLLVAHSDSYLVTNTLGLYCLDAETGSEIWSHSFAEEDLDAVDQPLYYNGQVIHMENELFENRMAFYDIANGEIIKRYYYDAQHFDQLGSIIYKDHLLFPAGTYNGLACVNVVTDSLSWIKRLIMRDEWSPSVHKDTVYTWLGGGLQGHDFYTGEQYWYVLPYLGLSDTVAINFSTDVKTHLSTRLSVLYAMYTTAVIDTILMVAYLVDDGELYGVDLRTREVLWEYNDKVGNYDDSVIVVSPATCNGILYTFFLNNLVAIEGRTGEIQWRAQLDTIPRAHPIVANGLIFVSTKYTTYAFDIASQDQVWSYQAGGYVTVANNHLYVSSNNGNIYAFEGVPTDVNDDAPNSIPNEFMLSQNFPNPFNPSTQIDFTVPTHSFVEISVYNSIGQHVKTLIKKNMSAGDHTITWDGTDNFGVEAPSGVYFYKLVAGDFVESKKMILLR